MKVGREGYFAYIRVSTARQGEQGSSLAEQRAAIEGYATRTGLAISEWFEERETAASAGRPRFSAMLVRLRRKEARGVIMHKIDRGARNLRDWVTLEEMSDAGVDIHLATESIDLQTRGGRLSADIQAVVAADYIRNLREEVRKGFYGRLRQGLYPLPAPLGYVDNGKGKPKTIDPVTGPLVRRAFELYATGQYTLAEISTKLNALGLRNRVGTGIRKNVLSDILNNPFYAGIILVKRTGERFEGAHERLIPMTLFRSVQDLLAGKVKHRGWKHAFLYRQTLRCAACHRLMIGERQKGHVYYRCQNPQCRGTSIREEHVAQDIAAACAGKRLRPSEIQLLRAHIADRRSGMAERQAGEAAAIDLQLAQLGQRRTRLLDAYIDRLIDKEAYEHRNRMLLEDIAVLDDRKSKLADVDALNADQLATRLELLEALSLSDGSENPRQQRDFVIRAGSNLRVQHKRVVVDWVSPFSVIRKDQIGDYGAPLRDSPRTHWVHDFLNAADDGGAGGQ